MYIKVGSLRRLYNQITGIQWIAGDRRKKMSARTAQSRIIHGTPMPKRFSRVSIAFTLLVCISSSLVQFSAAAEKKAAPKKNVGKEIESVLGQPPLDRAHWGLDVVDLDSGKPLYARNPDKLFLPASNAKLFTTAAALAIAGPDYRFRTTIEAEGKIDARGQLT